MQKNRYFFLFGKVVAGNSPLLNSGWTISIFPQKNVFSFSMSPFLTFQCRKEYGWSEAMIKPFLWIYFVYVNCFFASRFLAKIDTWLAEANNFSSHKMPFTPHTHWQRSWSSQTFMWTTQHIMQEIMAPNNLVGLEVAIFVKPGG